MKTPLYRFVGFLLLLWPLLVNCDQEPLFYDISMEIPPIKPLIDGAPSRIVEYNNKIYVSNGILWEYDGSSWHKMAQPPGGDVKTVAATTGYLFALSWNGGLYRWDGSTWTQTGTAGTKPEQIFGAGANLYAGALSGSPGTANGYCILEIDTSTWGVNVIKSSTGLLMGAATNGTNTFLGILYGGIVDAASPGAIISSPGNSVIGILNHNGTIVAVTAGGSVEYLDGGTFKTLTSNGDLSGALATWDDGTDKMLLLGIRDSSGSYGYGYRELHWDGNPSTVLTADRRLYYPGETTSLSSVANNIQYTNAIGDHPVTVLYVGTSSWVPRADTESRPIIVASTIKDGLWSYRTRGGQAQWNGEDNSN
ncbi:MAG: hypothetical protein LBO65_06580 [Spirochaetaceae bacterium]|jgi:hypothetical protein|nr:hypothetical protein [Spirochaetaceae bacterium]